MHKTYRERKPTAIRLTEINLEEEMQIAVDLMDSEIISAEEDELYSVLLDMRPWMEEGFFISPVSNIMWWDWMPNVCYVNHGISARIWLDGYFLYIKSPADLKRLKIEFSPTGRITPKAIRYLAKILLMRKAKDITPTFLSNVLTRTQVSGIYALRPPSDDPSASL